MTVRVCMKDGRGLQQTRRKIKLWLELLDEAWVTASEWCVCVVCVCEHVFRQYLMAASSGLHLATNVWLLLYLTVHMWVRTCV